MSAELAQITQLLNRVGKEGDAASMAGSVHGKLEYLATSGSDPGYLDGRVPKVHPETTTPPRATPGASQAWSAWVELVAANLITVDFVVVGVVGHPTYNSVNEVNRVQLGSGAAAAEVVIGAAGFHSYTVSATYAAQHQVMTPLAKPVKVAANSRIAFRVSAQNTHTVGVTLLYYPLA